MLLVAQDDADAASLGARTRGLGHVVCGVATCRDAAIRLADHTSPDVALIEVGVGRDPPNLAVAEHISHTLGIPVVFTLGAPDASDGDTMRRASACNPRGYLYQPFSDEQLELAIRCSLAVHPQHGPQGDAQIELQRRVARLEDLLQRTERELKRTVERLERQTRLTDGILCCTSDGVIVADECGKVTAFNHVAERILGAGNLDLKAEPECPSYGTSRRDRTTRVAAEELPLVLATSGQATDDVELFIRNAAHPDGKFIRMSGRPLIGDECGNGGVVVFREITREKETGIKLMRTATELRYQADLIDTAFRSISDGIFVISADGKFRYANPACERIIGAKLSDAPLEEWVQRYGAYYADRETPIATEDIVRAVRLGEPVDEEDVFIRHPGRPDGVYICVSVRPLIDDGSGIRGAVIVFRDVTPRVFAAEALAQAFAEGRLEIVDTLVHNISNAITSVATGVETLRRALADDRFGRSLAALADAVSAHREDWIDYLRDDPQGRKVLPLVTALCARYARQRTSLISTMERVCQQTHHIVESVRSQKLLGTTVTDRNDIDLNEALSAAFEVLRDLLAKNEIKTAIDCRNAPQEIYVRESQFHQMLVNLIKNALEAIDDLAAAQVLSEPPYIRVRVWCEGRFLILEVTDNGIGLKTKDRRALCAPGFTTKKSGTGLGLHSVANFVIGSGGRILPKSDGYGKGTTMRVMLPLVSVAPHRAHEDVPQGGHADSIAS